jgi:hypothetical protein
MAQEKMSQQENQRHSTLGTHAGSSVVYQSTKITPSLVFVGAMVIDFVFSTAMACSTSKRSRVYAAVEVLVRTLWISEGVVLVVVISLSGAVADGARYGSADSSSPFSLSSSDSSFPATSVLLCSGLSLASFSPLGWCSSARIAS